MPTHRFPLLRLMGALLLASMVNLVGGAAAGMPPPKATYVVQFDADVEVGSTARQLSGRGVQVLSTLHHIFPGAVVSATEAGARRLAAEAHVMSVEADERISATEEPSAPAPWGLDRIDQLTLPLDGEYAVEGAGVGVTAYVVDSGIRSDHTEFEGRVQQGFTSIPDGVGTEDCYGHGTHVAGTLGGAWSGAANRVALVPVRVLGCDGTGTTSELIIALEWMIGSHEAGEPAVANMSLTLKHSKAVDRAVQSLIEDGVVVVAAAGNSGGDACRMSPARVPGALTVGATDIDDIRATWSNTGRCMDIFAPGVRITSASHLSSTGTTELSGTSMAAPHVSGAVALLLERQPGLLPAEVAWQVQLSGISGVVGDAGRKSVNLLLHVPTAS